ncbi:DUF998 domain-containing protein [Actinomyces trachealis]|uniref:DUF998 domain-containing protein n=1 Tax=Actinomyces trachealis TaxID=2763540 RepID=UPI001892BEE0|nr:DUF998 domain-containing protein [Actinomyces trachealis]
MSAPHTVWPAPAGQPGQPEAPGRSEGSGRSAGPGHTAGPRQAARGRGRLRSRLLAGLVVTTYNSWVLWWLNDDPLVAHGYLSELAAQDQPYQWLFRLGDLLAAVCLLLTAWWGHQAWRPWLGSWARWVAASVAVAGLGTALDASFNLPCAESRDAVCAATPYLVRHLHELASVLVGSALVAAIALVAWALARRDGWGRRPVSVAALALLVSGLMVGSVLLPLALPASRGPVQALQVLLCSAWVGLLALRLEGADRA